MRTLGVGLVIIGLVVIDIFASTFPILGLLVGLLVGVPIVIIGTIVTVYAYVFMRGAATREDVLEMVDISIADLEDEVG